MGELLKRAVENRRRKLIEKLIASNVYKKGDQQLFELTLTEIENEIKRFKLQKKANANKSYKGRES